MIQSNYKMEIEDESFQNNAKNKCAAADDE